MKEFTIVRYANGLFLDEENFNGSFEDAKNRAKTIHLNFTAIYLGNDRIWEYDSNYEETLN